MNKTTPVYLSRTDCEILCRILGKQIASKKDHVFQNEKLEKEHTKNLHTLYNTLYAAKQIVR